jgi:uncharacterized protein YgiM (DUF1202 family)
MNKRIVSLIAVVVLLVSMLAVTSVASASYYCVYSHCGNGKALNIRSGPGKDFPSIGKVAYGDPIYVIGETYPGWLQLNDTGFVQAALTSAYPPGPYVPPTPTPTPDPQKKQKQADLESVMATAKNVDPYIVTLKATKTSKGKANVRWLPSKTSLLLKAYKPGDQVKVIAELKNWYQVQDLETEAVGFVNIAYVDK